MEKNNLNKNIEKQGLHPRNQHRFLYDFPALMDALPALKEFVAVNKYGNESIDFANPNAVKALNKALLIHHYGIEYWDIPPSYLCPPIPGRAEYLHYAADILSSCNKDVIPTGEKINVLDIGIGANCIYPIIGHQTYQWHFVGSDIDRVAIQSAEKIINNNPTLKNAVECRQQTAKNKILENIILPNEFYDVVICNPPFHASFEEASKGTQRKLNNLSKTKNAKKILNFGGKNTELWCEGGEIRFISNLIFESEHFQSNCFWFSTLVSKSENLEEIYEMLHHVRAYQVETINIEIGNKISRIVFWTFWNEKQQEEWRLKLAKV